MLLDLPPLIPLSVVFALDMRDLGGDLDLNEKVFCILITTVKDPEP
jgi:hypothetical protein